MFPRDLKSEDATSAYKINKKYFLCLMERLERQGQTTRENDAQI